VARMEISTAYHYTVPVWKPWGKWQLRRSRRRWKRNIQVANLELGYEHTYLMKVAQDRVRWHAVADIACKVRDS